MESIYKIKLYVYVIEKNGSQKQQVLKNKSGKHKLLKHQISCIPVLCLFWLHRFVVSNLFIAHLQFLCLLVAFMKQDGSYKREKLLIHKLI